MVYKNKPDMHQDMTKNNYSTLRKAYEKFPDRKLFCPLPFKHLEIMDHGNTLLCCYIRKSPGILQNGNLLDLYNSPAAQEIRQTILDNTFEYCNLKDCPHFSAGNLPFQADCLGTQYEDIVVTQSPYVKNVNIWLSFDQRCNLHCISCRDQPIKYSKRQTDEVNYLLQQVRLALPHIKNIGLSGSGDPFASPPLSSFLKELDADLYPELKITLLTNGILLNQKTWNKMHRASSAVSSIQVSVDAARKTTYEKIRKGGSYNTLKENLRFISRLRQRNFLKEFIISFVVNAYNYKEMDEFVSLGLDLNCDQVYFSAMMDWGALPKKQYQALAVHLPENPCHGDFKKRLQDKIFDHPIVFLGNLNRFRPNNLLRDSLFS